MNPVEKLIGLAKAKHKINQKQIALKIGEFESNLTHIKNGKRDIALFDKFLKWCEILEINPKDCF